MSQLIAWRGPNRASQAVAASHRTRPSLLRCYRLRFTSRRALDLLRQGHEPVIGLGLRAAGGGGGLGARSFGASPHAGGRTRQDRLAAHAYALTIRPIHAGPSFRAVVLNGYLSDVPEHRIRDLRLARQGNTLQNQAASRRPNDHVVPIPWGRSFDRESEVLPRCPRSCLHSAMS